MTTDSRTFGPKGLSDLLFGTDPRLRTRVRLCLLASTIYAFWLVINIGALRTGSDMIISEPGGWLLVAMELIAATTFYPLVRSGLTARLSDPGLVLPQMIMAFMVCCLGYVIVPDARGALMQVICVVQVFGLLSLSPRQVLQGGGAAVIAVFMAWLGGSLWAPIWAFDATGEALQLGMAAFILTLLTLMSHRYSQMRSRVRAQKKDLSEAVAQVEHIVTHDTLTGLYNRRHMVDVINRELARTERSGIGLALVVIDLDHFKRINDTHGHQVGDAVLKAFAEIAQSVLRETDVIGRWGGEEFVVLMPDTEPAARATTGLQRLRNTLAGAIVCDDLPDLRVQFSAGVAIPVPNETMDGVVERADHALYSAKQQGRNITIVAE
ncbi:MAG TPA: diguanylate cyclase [Aquabacterium sp.]|uniref:GGDEF domain-containing protein n=1 Tax=Aquabacterium sp. TaxID=1872578 RepID=UPI002E35BC83|nr:diguanylate cyclase [Aquabacterium sp.]HEX5371793.1 diguanylate cyclase [Aquabacterium sp.]